MCSMVKIIILGGWLSTIKIYKNNLVKSTIWLIFSITSFVDMYIFRQSGFVALLPHIIHHMARVGLYYMMYIFPESKEGSKDK
mgnify:CR=1 FL=1